MKLLLTKFRISAALDSGRPLPESLRRKIAAEPELERFVNRIQALRRPSPEQAPSDPSLHDSIMRAVRASAQRRQPQRAPVWSWLSVSASLAALAVLVFWMANPRPAPSASSTMDGPVSVLEMSERMPATMPSIVMAPLSNEWAMVNHDVRGTTQILLASFP